eukprot:CFRG5313T1
MLNVDGPHTARHRYRKALVENNGNRNPIIHDKYDNDLSNDNVTPVHPEYEDIKPEQQLDALKTKPGINNNLDKMVNIKKRRNPYPGDVVTRAVQSDVDVNRADVESENGTVSVGSDATVPHGKDALRFSARDLLVMKSRLYAQLDRETVKIESATKQQNPILSDPNTEIQLRMIKLKQKELNLTQALLMQAFESLHLAVSSETNSIEDIGTDRMNELQNAVLGITQGYKEVIRHVAALKKVNDKIEKNNLDGLSMLDDVLDAVSKDADDVENKMKEEKFEQATGKKDAKLQTVLILNEDENGNEKQDDDTNNVETHAGMKVQSKSIDTGTPYHLIDPENNQYVLTRAHDATTHYEDHRLLLDIVVMIIAVFIGILVCHLLGMPTFFGSLAAGVVVGPVGMNYISSHVQLNTVGQLGIFFILFILGMEFNMDQLRQTFKTSVYGSLLMGFLVFVTMTVLATWAGQSLATSILVSSCVSLASTAVTLKLLSPQEVEVAYGRTMIGILVIQDVYFGLCLTLLPLLEGDMTGSQAIYAFFEVFKSMVIFSVVNIILINYVMDWFLLLLRARKSHEVHLLGLLFLCMMNVLFAEYMKLSLEIGCFTAGLLVSSSSSSRSSVNSHEILILVEPIRDLFASLFFGTIGLHVYPSFMIAQWKLLVVMTLSCMAIKFITGFFVLYKVFKQPVRPAALASLGLAQISEFAFILASRGKTLKIISREVYYLILGTTTLTLLFIPLMFTALRKATMGGRPNFAPIIFNASSTNDDSQMQNREFLVPRGGKSPDMRKQGKNLHVF